MHTMHQQVSKDLVKGLLALDSKQSPSSDACIRCKQVRSSFITKKMISTARPYEILHIDLCGSIRVRSIRGKSYTLVIVEEKQGALKTHSLILSLMLKTWKDLLNVLVLTLQPNTSQRK